MTGQERVAFRPMEPEDRSAVLALSRAWAEENITYGYAPDGEKELEDYRCWVAELGGRVVSYAAGQVDKGNVAPCFLRQLHRSLKQNPGQSRVVVIGDGVGSQEGVQSKVPCPQFLEPPVGLGELWPGHAVFGVSRLVHHLKSLFTLP